MLSAQLKILLTTMRCCNEPERPPSVSPQTPTLPHAASCSADTVVSLLTFRGLAATHRAGLISAQDRLSAQYLTCVVAVGVHTLVLTVRMAWHSGQSSSRFRASQHRCRREAMLTRRKA